MAAITKRPARPVFIPGRAGAESARASVATVTQSRVETRRGARRLARLMAMVMAGLLVLPLAEGTQTAEAGKKFKTISKTFSSNGQIDIPDVGTEGPADPYPSIIEVDAFEKYKKAKIKDVNLTLRNFSHTLPENVDVMLALGNRRAIVMGDAGGGVDAVNLTITLDDQATDELPDGDELFSGSYKPANLPGADPFPAPAPAPNANSALSTFNNANPDGQWRLFVHDDANGHDGEFAGGWKLEITAKAKNDKKDKTKDKDKEK